MRFSSAQSFTAEDLRKMVGEDTIARYKQNGDPEPFFKAFVAMSEGMAFPALEGVTQKPIMFSRGVINQAYSAIKQAIGRAASFLIGHNPDGQDHGAPKAGEIVAADVRDIKGQKSIVVAGYFPPESRSIAEKAKAISVEGLIRFTETARNYIANFVDNITGIALLPENQDPGFANAVALVQLRAQRMTAEGTTLDLATMPASEFRRAIRENRIRPEDLYEPEDLLSSAPVKKHTDGLSAQAAKLAQEKADFEATANKQIKDLRTSAVKNEALPLLKNLAVEKKINPKAAEWAEKRIGSVNFDPDQDLGKQVGNFLDISAKEFEEMTKLIAPAPAAKPTTPSFDSPFTQAGRIAEDAGQKNPFLPV